MMNLITLSRRTAAIAVAFGLCVVASPDTRVAAQQGQAFGQQVDVEGLLEVQIEDSDAGAIIHYSIDTANGRWDLKVPPGQIKNLLSGSDVQVRGKQTGQNSIDLGTDGTMTLLAPAAPNTFGVQRVAVIMVNFSDNQSISQTAADAANVTFGTVNNFYVENSYSQTSLTGDVFGWFTIPMTSAVCDTTTLAAQADQAVTNSGVNLSLYTRKVYSFPKNACTWWGLSTVGGSPSQSWINGTYSLKVVAHELGHGFGVYHSKSAPCDSAGGCSTIEYGDDRDIMGQSGTGHMNAYQKERLGWLNYDVSPAILSVTGPGSYRIDSLQTSGGTKALKILKSTSGGNTFYYVESRAQIGFDAGYGPGIILHTGNDSNGDTSVQIDLDPVTTAFDAVLDPGQAFSDASIGLTITASSSDASGSWVTVQMPQGPPCSYSISPTSSGSLSYNGANSSFSVTSGPGCTWSATTTQSWIHTSSTGAGNGTVSYFVDSNGGNSRTGSISVGGQTFTVSQAAAPCVYSLNPTASAPLSGAGASGSTQMTAGPNCSWSAVASKNWIHTSSAGTGNGTISYTVDANTGQARSGTIKAGGQTYTVNQAPQAPACSYTLNPTSSGTLAAAGAAGSFTVTSASGCLWSASPSASWIHASNAGSGNGTVTYTVDANTGNARSGSINVATQSFSVSQAAGCKAGTPGCKK